jgi:hypothetical protein
MRFFSATFGAGVNASHCPITRPKRRKQPERYVKWGLNWLKILKIYENNKLRFDIIKNMVYFRIKP